MILQKITPLFNSQSDVCRVAAGSIMLRLSISLLLFVSVLIAFESTALAAGFCATPGKDGIAGSLSGVINTYYPVTASVTAGATSITLGTPRGASTGITAGDMLLVVQMQDADINYSNNNAYGSGGTSGAGYTAINQAGVYEYVKATNTVGTGGGTVNLSTGLTYSYRYRTASATNGTSRFQVIRVPQYSTATVAAAGVTASPWNGATGGIVAIDVVGELTMTGNIDVSGLGFRGGWGENANTGGLNTDYRTRANVTGNGMKGEGIAGTPNRMNMPASYGGAPVMSTTGNLGYPNGTNTDASKARGAPGNAGGGGSDGAANNGDNSGGGGGGNYGPGGKGGNSWNSNYSSGGEGGGSVPVAFNKIFLGGGGGAGTTNNGDGDNTTYSNPPGIACNLTGGNCSSGAPGGGIVIVRAQSMSGAGTIHAQGGSGYNVQQDGSGGGGGGGTVILETYSGGTATVNVTGGNGGNSWRSQDPNGYPGERHGPGGGGSGGFIAYAPSSFSVVATYDGGVSGATTTAGDQYGSAGTVGGTSTYQAPNVPGSNTGYDCSPKLTKAYSAVNISEGASSTLTFTITNGTNNQPQSGMAFTDSFPAGLTVTAVSAISGVGCSGTPGFTASTVTLSGGAMTLGTVTCTFTATISGDTAGAYVNDSSRFSGVSGALNTDATTATLTVIGAPPPGSGNKPLYLYGATGYELSRTPTPGTPAYIRIPELSEQTWTLSDDLASAVTLDPAISTTVPVNLYMASNQTRTISATVTLACSSGGATLTQTLSEDLNTTPEIYNPPFNLPLGALLTCPAGSRWQLTIRNNTSGVGTRDLRVYPVNGSNLNTAIPNGQISQVILPSQNVINVDSISLYNNSYASSGVPVTSALTGSTVYIRATVSDPFGAYDINTPSIAITDKDGSPVVPAAPPTAMTEIVALATAGTKTFEYPYSVPAGGPVGNWLLQVTATEGTEGTVSHTRQAIMPVVIPQPLLSILKFADIGNANPGQAITYTVQIVNTGAGIGTSVILRDDMSPYSAFSVIYGTTPPFSFSDSSPASGLSLGTPEYSFDNGSNWTTTTPAGGINAPAGYNGNVTNWKIPMAGTIRSGGSFILKYQVQVK
jgi:hypothetical protein